jgi:hypothetical protein
MPAAANTMIFGSFWLYINAFSIYFLDIYAMAKPDKDQDDGPFDP